ncbi:30S ribosomal protein S6 [Peptococcaceae bacterium 1198_IL3148]
MRNYELMYILRTDLEEEATEAVINKFTDLIEKNGGEVVKVDKWGKRRLAYPIKKRTEGFYVLVDFKSEPAVSHEVERVLKITDEVLRHMVIVKE